MNQKAIGAVLWIAVFVAIGVLYQSTRQASNAAQRKSGTADGSPDSSTTDSASSAEADPASSGVVTIPRKPMKLSDFTLTNSEGREVTKADIIGKPAVFSFIFTCCADTCPAIMLNMKKVHDKVPDEDVRFFTITMDPERDDVEKMASYADIYDPDPERWQFLTGDKAVIHNMIMNDFNQMFKQLFGEEARPGFEFMHTNSVVLIDAEGRPVKTFPILDDVGRAKLVRVLNGKDPFPKPPSAEFKLTRPDGKTEDLSADGP